MRIEVELWNEMDGLMVCHRLDSLSLVYLDGYKLNYIAPIGVRSIEDET